MGSINGYWANWRKEGPGFPRLARLCSFTEARERDSSWPCLAATSVTFLAVTPSGCSSSQPYGSWLPPMKAMGYNQSFSLGAIAGSSCLGMLIPPSVLMIVWGILTELSIGALFLAGGSTLAVSAFRSADATVVATGGLSELIAPHSELIQHREPQLTLHGLRLVHEKNAR